MFLRASSSSGAEIARVDLVLEVYRDGVVDPAADQRRDAGRDLLALDVSAPVLLSAAAEHIDLADG
jgi:hypothetical protein